MNKNKKLINTADEGVRPFIRTSQDVYNEMDWAKKKVLYYLVGASFERKEKGESIEPIDVLKEESNTDLINVEEILKHFTDEEFNFLEEMLERVKNGKLKKTKTEEE